MIYSYYEYYENREGVYHGVGEMIVEDHKTLFTQKRSSTYQLSRRGNMQRLAEGFIPKLLKEHYRTVDDLFNILGAETAVSNLIVALGPLGRDDFKKDENGMYVCSNFVFDKDWFTEQLDNVQALYKAYKHFIGDVVEEIPKRYENAISRRLELYKELSSTKKISGADLEEATHAALTPHQRKLLKELSLNRGKLVKRKLVNAHRDNESKDMLFDALSNCMNNVRAVVRHSPKSDTEIKAEYVPLNVFGAYTLFIMEAYKNKLHYVKCPNCEREHYSTERSSGVCDGCLTTRRQRKYTIKSDIAKGLDLEAIIAVRKKLKREDIVELYNEIMQEKATK